MIRSTLERTYSEDAHVSVLSRSILPPSEEGGIGTPGKVQLTMLAVPTAFFRSDLGEPILSSL
jgi:hypothetical protein